ncbi:MAG TPA: hypothetical protein VE377_09170 [Candidatus Dormibacteraeota bacterium]|nr:hypothetical protein [Candidatus Dormibacteraeota bacterium]
MVENSTSIWHSIVRDKWRGASISGDGPHAVVLRCTETTHVHLFSTYMEAQSFQLAFCDAPVCWKRHTIGSLIPFVPAPPKLRGENLRRMMEAE